MVPENAARHRFWISFRIASGSRLGGRTAWNRRLWRPFDRAPEAVAGHEAARRKCPPGAAKLRLRGYASGSPGKGSDSGLTLPGQTHSGQAGGAFDHAGAQSQLPGEVDRVVGADDEVAQLAHLNIGVRIAVVCWELFFLLRRSASASALRSSVTPFCTHATQRANRMRCLICLTSPCASAGGQPTAISAAAVSLSESSVTRTDSMSMIAASSKVRRERSCLKRTTKPPPSSGSRAGSFMTCAALEDAPSGLDVMAIWGIAPGS